MNFMSLTEAILSEHFCEFTSFMCFSILISSVESVISSAISYWRRLLASGFRKLRFAEPIIAETGVLFFEKQYNLPWYLNAFTIRISPMPEENTFQL